jgi:hypothetical protein
VFRHGGSWLQELQNALLQLGVLQAVEVAHLHCLEMMVDRGR